MKATKCIEDAIKILKEGKIKHKVITSENSIIIDRVFVSDLTIKDIYETGCSCRYSSKGQFVIWDGGFFL